jgi:penicillin-binding protein 1C
MILGGCGATLEELTGLYSIFANEGRWVKPMYTTDDTAADVPLRNAWRPRNADTGAAISGMAKRAAGGCGGERGDGGWGGYGGRRRQRGERILSPAATFMINEILSKVSRPDFPLNWQSTEHLPKIAWKTGRLMGVGTPGVSAITNDIP